MAKWKFANPFDRIVPDCTNSIKAARDNGFFNPPVECELCVKPKGATFTPTSTCFDFVDPGVQLRSYMMIELVGATGPGVTTFNDSFATTYGFPVARTGTMHRNGAVCGPAPQVFGPRFLQPFFLEVFNQGAGPGLGIACTDQITVLPQPPVYITSGWWEGGAFGSREYLPDGNPNPWAITYTDYPEEYQAGDGNLLGNNTLSFDVSLDGGTGLVTVEVQSNANISLLGDRPTGFPYGNVYLSNAFVRDLDGAIETVPAADVTAPSGFDPIASDVPNFRIEASLQINPDGTWSQTSLNDETGGTGNLNLWLA